MPRLKIFALLGLLCAESGILTAATPVPGVPPRAPCSLDIPWPRRARPSCTEDSWRPRCCRTHGCQREGDPFLHGGETWHLLPTCPILSPSRTLGNSTGGCKVNPVCNMQPCVMQRGCTGNCPFAKPICILRQAVIKLGIAK